MIGNTATIMVEYCLKGANAMLHIAICDDDPAELAQARTLLDDYLASRALAARVGEFSSGKALLFELDGSSAFDIYLLDIVMPGMNGIELGLRLREVDENGAIIYLTTSEDFAIDSYAARAFWYLVKPVEAEALYSVLDKAVAACRKRMNDGVNVRTRDGYVRLLFDDIYYVESVDRSAHYVHRGGVVEGTVSSVSFQEKTEPLLADRRFFRCGASLVLNLHCVKSVDRSGATLRTGERLALPRRATAELCNAWRRYWLEGGGRP